jgi:hypothetical protein
MPASMAVSVSSSSLSGMGAEFSSPNFFAFAIGLSKAGIGGQGNGKRAWMPNVAV